MGALTTDVAPAPQESAYGLLLRTLVANGANVRELLALTRNNTRRQIVASDAPLYEALTGVPSAWFAERIPTELRGESWAELEVFGSRWRNDWTLRGQHTQVCPPCLIEFGFARLEWDLTPFVACPIHGEVLVDRCYDCGRALMPNRPAVDICRCGSFIGAATEHRQTADPLVLQWCRWLSATLLAAMGQAPYPAQAPIQSLSSLSPDGSYRLAVCFGGGVRALRGAHLNSASPWLGTSAVHAILRDGLTALMDIEHGRPPRVELGLGCGDSLAEQAVRGVAAADRHAASHLRQRLRLRSRWRNMKQVVHEQGDLFEGLP